MTSNGRGHAILGSLLEERTGPDGMYGGRAQPLLISTSSSPRFLQSGGGGQADEEAQRPLISGSEPNTPRIAPWKKGRNIVIMACMGAVLVFLVVLTAVSSSRSNVDNTGPTHSPPPSPFPFPPPSPFPFPPPAPSPPLPYTTPTASADYRGKPRRAVSSQGMVAADQSECSDIGAQVLEAGGNAVDAAVATCLCQGVMNPFASGMGGGFFAVIRGANGSSEFIDARETAPAAATWDMYNGMPSTASVIGGLAIAVPLELKGLELMWRRWGRLPWSRLVSPSVALARHGFPAYPYLVYTLRPPVSTLIQKNPLLAASFLVRDEGGALRAPTVGEHCCARPALADTLEAVAQNGAQWLFTPERAATLAREMRTAGGIMTAEDLINTQPLALPVIKMKVLDYEVLLPPPPSSAAVMGLAMRILTGFIPPSGSTPNRWTGMGNATEPQLLFEHRLVESLKQAFALRLSLGDPGAPGGPAYANITDVLRDILDASFADQLRSDIKDSGVLNVTEYGRQWSPYKQNTTARGLLDDRGTSHMSVVDFERMAVSLTTTVNGPFGSFVMSESTGILWNNEMDDFSRPDLPNSYGLAPSSLNYVVAGKRPLSSMSPAIITQGGQLRMVVGASNGPRIISSTLQTIVRILLLGWDPLEAVSGARVHHQLLPYSVKFENYTMPAYDGYLKFVASQQLQTYLKDMGNGLTGESGQLGNSQVIYCPPGSNDLIGASDPRKDGAPAAPRT